MLEALAYGTPVAAFFVQGASGVVGGSGVAVLDEDLRKAALQAMRIDGTSCRAHTEQQSWHGATAPCHALQRLCRQVPRGHAALDIADRRGPQVR